MSMSAILLITLYPILFILYVMMRSEAKPRKNILLGVTLPFEARMDETVLAYCKAYKKWLLVVMLLLGILPLGILFITRIGLAMLLFMTWVLLLIVVAYIPYIVYHKKLKALKQARGYMGQSAGKALIDTQVAEKLPQKRSAWWYLPAILISAIPVIATIYQGLAGDKDAFLLLILFGAYLLCTLCLYFFARIIYRQRAEVIDENTQLSIALTRVRRYHWEKSFLYIAWLMALGSLGTWLFMDTGWWYIVFLFLSVAGILFAAIRAELATRKAQYALAAQSGTGVYADDDDNWIWGMFYYNPHDKHFLINNRVGMGTTVNMGRTSGKVMMGFTVLLMLSLPFMGLWLMAEEDAGVRLELTDSALVASHTARAYTIAIEDIQSLALLNALPSGTRVAGTSMDTVLKGNFRLNGIGACKLCLNPQAPPFLVITTGEDVFIVAAQTGDETRSIYAQLENKLHE